MVSAKTKGKNLRFNIETRSKGNREKTGMLEAKRMGNEKKDARVVNVESKQGMGILKGGMMKQRE